MTTKKKVLTTKDTKSTKIEFDNLSNRMIGYAIEVHRKLGPGLLESAYEHLKSAGVKTRLWHEVFRSLIPSCSSCPSW